MSTDDAPNLTTLPADIIWRIIGHAKESIESMRMISARWNLLVKEHIRDGKHLAVINSVYWSVNSAEKSAFKLCFHPKYRQYFGVECWLSWPVDSDTETTSDVRMFKSIDNDAGIDQIPRIFKRCGHIGKLELDMNFVQRQVEIDMIVKAIDGVVVEQLIISCFSNPKYAYRLLSILRARAIHRLVLSATDFDRFKLTLNQFKNHGILYSGAVGLGISIELVVIAPMNRYWTYERTIAHWQEKMEAHRRKWKVEGRLEIEELSGGRVRISIIGP